MKRFDYQSIKDRLIKRMEQNSDFASVIDDGTLSNLFDVFGEAESELARYLEALLRETKWSTAVNISSLTSLGNLIGRKRARPKSSMGVVIVSHTDAQGNDRLANYGQTFFDVDATSDYDELTQDTDATYIEKSALVPWTCKKVYSIPKGTIFESSGGIKFISTETVKARVMTTAYSVIEASDEKLSSFLESGGWDGIKYLKVPVIQGIQRSQELGTSTGERYMAFTLAANNVENASNYISKNFFYVEVVNPDTGDSEKWAEIQKISLAGPYDKVFESRLTADGEGLVIKFGNGTSGKIPTSDSTIILHYLETLGEDGNIESKFQITSMTPPSGSWVDPRTSKISDFLSCTNISSIMGGQDIEDEEDYRTNAPTSYLTSYTTAVKASYEEQIMKNSPVSLSKIVCYPSSSFTASQVDTTYDENVDEEVVNEISVISNSLNVSAIRSNGEMVTDEESDTFIKTITKAIGDLKGPNDSLNYIEPNLIKVAPSVTINTYDLATTESEIKTDISGAILSEYSIFNTNFKSGFYPSRIYYMSSLFSFTDSASIMIEALANVDMGSDAIKVMGMTYTNSSGSELTQPIVAIPFNFDTVYTSNQYESGFKNCSVNAPYLLKIDLQMINNSSSDLDSYARTFFLYDNRDSTDVSLTEAIAADAESGFTMDSASVTSASSNLGESLYFFKENNDTYKNRTVRVAQFPFIDDITNDTFMGCAKDFSQSPYENRPYEVDNDGCIKQFDATKVSSSDRVTISGTSSSATVCYKKNNDYIDYVNILFYENYDNPDSTDYARGYFIIPVSYFGFEDSLPTWTMSDESNDAYVEKLSQLLKNYVSLKVYARPIQEDIEPQTSNSIVFVDDDDIKVEKNTKYKE